MFISFFLSGADTVPARLARPCRFAAVASCGSGAKMGSVGKSACFGLAHGRVQLLDARIVALLFSGGIPAFAGALSACGRMSLRVALRLALPDLLALRPSIME